MLTMHATGFIVSETFDKDASMPIEKGWLTITEAAALMDVTHQTVWTYVRRGLFKNAYRMPGGRTSPWRIPIDDIRPYVPKNKLALPKKRARSN